MKTQLALTLSAPLFLLTMGLAPAAAAKNNKVDICHLTGSATNPGVLINVSVKAAAAHYGHGDPEPGAFTVLPNGRCVADSTPPVIIEVTACSYLDSDPLNPTLYLWAVDYYPATGKFDGTSSGGAGPIAGTISPAGEILVEGKSISYTVDDIDAISSSTSTYEDLDVSDEGVLFGAYYPAKDRDSQVNVSMAFTSGPACTAPLPPVPPPPPPPPPPPTPR